MEKTHYRKVFKSDHLGVADLEEYLEEGKKLIFTIKEVKQEYEVMVAGRKGNHNIAYFNENIKPLVLNSTNSKVIKKFNGNSSFIEDWSNTLVELYIDANVKMKGEIVGGVRIKSSQPIITESEELKELIELFEAKKDKIPTESVSRINKTIQNKVEKNYIQTIEYLNSL